MKKTKSVKVHLDEADQQRIELILASRPSLTTSEDALLWALRNNPVVTRAASDENPSPAKEGQFASTYKNGHVIFKWVGGEKGGGPTRIRERFPTKPMPLAGKHEPGPALRVLVRGKAELLHKKMRVGGQKGPVVVGRKGRIDF